MNNSYDSHNLDLVALKGLIFPYFRNSHPAFPGGLYDIYGRLYRGVGRPHWGFPDFGHLHPYRPQAPYRLFGTQSGNFRLTPLGFSASGPPGYDRYRQNNSSFLY